MYRWGSSNSEVDTSGKHSMRLWLKRLGVGILAVIVLAFVVGTGYESYARQRAHSEFSPRGAMVGIGDRRIHLDCRGQGSPTVVFEAGLDTYGSLAWSAVHDEVAAVTRACAYDRAGIMWSDPKRGPQHADAIADDLHATLAASGEPGPYVFVAHSLGAVYTLDYTRKFGEQVAGLVFVDGSHPDQNRRLRAAGLGQLTQVAPPIAVALSKVTWTGWTRLLGNVSAVENAPANAAEAAGAYASMSMRAAMNEAVGMERSLSDVGAFRTLDSRPLVVLTAMRLLPDEALQSLGMTPADASKVQSIWKELHDDQASWSSHARHQVVPDSSHYIQFDRADVVIAAVNEVVGDVRQQSSASSESLN
jgi:pimeloyl-ACP methyl ester carboxylesterase